MDVVPGMEHVEKAQAGIERSPLAFTAALFAVAFVALLVYHLRSSARHARELLELSIKVETTLANFVAYVNHLPKPRKSRARRGVEPDEPTVRMLIERKEGPDAAHAQSEGADRAKQGED